MESRKAAHEFGESYKRIYDRFYRRVKAAEFQPSREALAVLRHLTRTGPLTVTEAARHFSRSQASTSELFARMERRGLLAGVVDDADRRRTLVWLTDEGTAALEGATQVLSLTKLEHALDQLDDSGRTAVVAALESLLETKPQANGWDND